MEELLRIIEKNPKLPLEDLAAMLDQTPEETAKLRISLILRRTLMAQ